MKNLLKGIFCIILLLGVLAAIYYMNPPTPRELYQKGVYYGGAHEGIPANLPEAMKFFQLSAAADYLPAKAMLCDWYFAGIGAPRDYDKAAAICRQVASYDYPLSQANLGLMLVDGLGVERNFEEGYFWLKLSSDRFFLANESNHVDEVAHKLLIASQNISSAQLEAANLRVQSWVPKDDPFIMTERLPDCTKFAKQVLRQNGSQADFNACLSRCVSQLKKADPRNQKIPMCPLLEKPISN